jgi:hypothetical protein
VVFCGCRCGAISSLETNTNINLFRRWAIHKLSSQRRPNFLTIDTLQYFVAIVSLPRAVTVTDAETDQDAFQAQCQSASSQRSHLGSKSECLRILPFSTSSIFYYIVARVFSINSTLTNQRMIIVISSSLVAMHAYRNSMGPCGSCRREGLHDVYLSDEIMLLSVKASLQLTTHAEAMTADPSNKVTSSHIIGLFFFYHHRLELTSQHQISRQVTRSKLLIKKRPSPSRTPQPLTSSTISRATHHCQSIYPYALGRRLSSCQSLRRSHSRAWRYILEGQGSGAVPIRITARP